MQPSPASKLQRALKPIGNRPAQVTKPLPDLVKNLGTAPKQGVFNPAPSNTFTQEKAAIEAHQRSSVRAKQLYATAFDHTQPVSKRLSAARALRQNYGFPVSQKDYMKSVQPAPPQSPKSADTHHSFFHNLLHGVENAALGLGRAEMNSRDNTAQVVRDYPRQLGKALGQIEQMHRGQQEGMGGNFVTGLASAGKATLEHPGKVLSATAKSLPATAEGLLAGPIEAVAKPGDTLAALRKDYSNRYGKNAGKAVQKEGLLPYALDAATVVAPAARATGVAAREGALGEVGRTVMAERPNLRVSAERAVAQEKSPNIIKAAGQTVADNMRRKAAEGRQSRGTPRGIEPQRANEVVPYTRRGAAHAQAKSFGFQSGLSRNLHAQGRQELRNFFEKELPKTLSKDQMEHGAFRYALEHGIHTQTAAREFLPALREQILTHRTERQIEFEQKHAAWVKRGKTGKEPKLPLRSADELQHLDYLIAHPELFDANVAAMASKARDLGSKLGLSDPRLTEMQARERALTPQALLLKVAPRKGSTLRPVVDAKQAEPFAQFEQRAATAREKAGLAEPGYFPHKDLLKPRLSDYVRGSGVHGAIKGPHETNYDLMQHGEAVVHPKALNDALARNLKSHFNVNHVANTVQKFALRHLVDQESGKKLNVQNQTFHQLELAMERAGVTDVVPYRPQTIYDGLKDHQGDDLKYLKDAYSRATTPGELKNVKGWYLIPKAIDKQMQESMRFQGPIARALGKNKSFNTKLILGTNPSWPMMRVIHNLGLSAAQGINPLKGLEARSALDEGQLKQLQAYAGSNTLHADVNPPRIAGALKGEHTTAVASYLHDLVNSDTSTGKVLRNARKLSPFQLLDQLVRPTMAAERHQNSFFREAAAYQKLSRDAKSLVAGHVHGFVNTAEKLTHPNAVDKLLNDPHYMEDLGRHVNQVFGDFASYPGVHRLLQQNVMFYGFVRFSVRLLAYTLPANHPIMLNLGAELSRMHEKEVRKLLHAGPNDPLPFGALANIYSRDAKGNLSVYNLHRANPILSALIESADNPRAAAVGSLPYSETQILSQMADADLLRMKGLRVKGNAQAKGIGDHISVPDRGRIALKDFLDQVAAYRVAEQSKAGGNTLGNDSLLWNQRPILHSSVAGRTQDILNQQFGKKVGTKGAVLKAELPFLPQPSKDDQLTHSLLRNQQKQNNIPLTPKEQIQDLKLKLAQAGYSKAYVKAAVQVAMEKEQKQLAQAKVKIRRMQQGK